VGLNNKKQLMKKPKINEMYDAVLIGSGVGSLTTAAILADYGKKVIVLEKHHKIGGYTHAFRRKSWYWDVAVHYLNSMNPGDLFFHGCRYLTQNRLRWRKLPHVFDHFCFPDFQVDVPSEPDEYQSHLISLFPAEYKAIDRYFNDMELFSKRLQFLFLPKLLPGVLSKIAKPICRMMLKKTPEQSVEKYFQQIGSSQKLKAAICAPWATYGGLPEECSVYEHWITYGSYRFGAWYPAGGAQSISEYLKDFIEKKGGTVAVESGVEEIVLDSTNKKAIGVRLESSDVVHGKSIVSGVGIHSTFTKLLPERQVPEEMKQVLKEYKNSVSYTQLFIGLKDDPSKIPGIDGSNYWISSTTDFKQDLKELEPENDTNDLRVKAIMLTFPSLKDPDAKAHTLTVCAWINFDQFAGWADSDPSNRPNDYKSLKRRLEIALLEPVLARFPRLEEMIEYTTLGTPLTIKDHLSHGQGSAYGILSPPGRFSDDRLHPKTEIKELYLTGSDIATSGVPGAFLGATVCASAILNKIILSDLIKKDKRLYG
jgi:all-trans-retinol 13,14-reductase